MATTAQTVWDALYAALVSSLEGTAAGKFRKITDGYMEANSMELPTLAIEFLNTKRGLNSGLTFQKIMLIKIRIAYEIDDGRPGQSALKHIAYVDNFLDALTITGATKFSQETEWAPSTPEFGISGQIGIADALFKIEIDTSPGSN